MMRYLAAVAIASFILMPGIRAQDPQPENQPGTTEEADDPETESPQPSASGKWKRFRDAARGLVTWNLFGGRLTLRGYMRLQFDATMARFDDVLASTLGDDQVRSIDVRRLSFHIRGTIDNHLAYVAGFEFGPDYGPTATYLEGIEGGLKVFGYRIGDFRVGFFQEPFSLARVTSSFDSAFLERSLPTWTFGPGNNLGYMVYNRGFKQRLTWQFGFFSVGVRNDANASNSTLSVTTRVTGRPLYRDGGRKMVHLGLAYSTRTPRGSEAQYRSRPEARFVDFLVDTGRFDSSRIQLLGLEAAAVRGPLSIQAEAIASRVTSSATGDPVFWGSAVEVSYFLTGETRPYEVSSGRFGRLFPKSNYRKGLPLKRSNGGAFEVVGRYSKVDLEDGGVQGGKLRDLSLGFNWYIDASSRVMFNVVRADAGDRGDASIFLLRYQYQPRAD